MSERSADHAVIILAAGAAARMRPPKQLLDVAGEPMVRRAARAALDSGASCVIVVLGAHAQEVRPALDDLPVLVTVDEQWRNGVGSSIAAGLRIAEARGVRSVTLTLSDQPFVNASVLRALAARRQFTNAPLVAAKYAGRVGVPVVFASELFPDLRALPSHGGCRGLIGSHVNDALLIDCPEASIVINTPEDYARLSCAGS